MIVYNDYKVKQELKSGWMSNFLFKIKTFMENQMRKQRYLALVEMVSF